MANLSSTRIFGDGTIERSLYVKQRLGVGVGSPDYAVDVFGDIRLNAEGSGNGKAQVRFNEGSGTSAYIGYDGENLNGGDNRLEFNSNGTHMVIQNRGRVGIGTTSPNQKLDVEGAADLNGRLNMRGNDVRNVDQVEIDGASGRTMQVRGGANTTDGLSVRTASNVPGDRTMFAVESSGGATRFGVTQNNGAFFRNQLWVNSGGATDNGEIGSDEIEDNSPREIALRLGGGIGFNSSGTFTDSRIQASGGDIALISSSGASIDMGSRLLLNGDSNIQFDFDFETIEFQDIGSQPGITFRNVFGGYPSNSELNSLLDDNDAVIFPYDAGSFIDLGWAARENGSLTTGSFQINNA